MRIRHILAGLLLLTSPVVAQSPTESVLFPFDDNAIPFNKGVLLTLIPGEKSKPVLTPGKPGAPDDRRVYFAGTIIKVGDEYRMWYAGYDQAATRHACYAASKDGLEWARPDLGLVEYNGSKSNNLVSIDGGELKSALFLVLHDPESERSLAILLFDSEDDYRRGDEALNAMPTDDTPGQRTSVTKYDVAVRVSS